MNAGWDGSWQGVVEKAESSCEPERVPYPASFLGDLVQFVPLRLTDKTIVALAR